MDTSPGLELFSNYEAEYSQLVSAIRNSLDKEAKAAAGEQRKTILRRVERDLEEADEIISQMDIELQSLDKSLKPKMQTKLRTYRAGVDQSQERDSKNHNNNTLPGLKEDVYETPKCCDRKLYPRQQIETTSSPVPPPRTLPRHPPPNGTSAGQAQRARLLQGTSMLADGQRRLEDSHRIAMETEDLGAGILRDLQGQREQLEGTRGTLQEADGHIDKASNTLNKMIRRWAPFR